MPYSKLDGACSSTLIPASCDLRRIESAVTQTSSCFFGLGNSLSHRLGAEEQPLYGKPRSQDEKHDPVAAVIHMSKVVVEGHRIRDQYRVKTEL